MLRFDLDLRLSLVDATIWSVRAAKNAAYLPKRCGAEKKSTDTDSPADGVESGVSIHLRTCISIAIAIAFISIFIFILPARCNCNGKVLASRI